MTQHEVREHVEIDTPRQVWFYSGYDVEVHAIELEQPGNSTLPSSRVSQGQSRKIPILPGLLTRSLPVCSPRWAGDAWRRLKFILS